MDADDALSATAQIGDNPARIEVVAEDVHVATRQIETHRAVVQLITDTKPITLHGETVRGALQIERVAVERIVDIAPEPREEDGVLIYSILEERAVLIKQLVVIEEVRVTRTTTTQPIELSTTVRQQRVTVEHRFPAPTGETNG